MKRPGKLAGGALKKRYKLRRKGLKEQEEKLPIKTKMKRKTMTKIILHPEVNTLPTSR